MAFERTVWDQIKNTTTDRLIRALLIDGWKEDVTSGATRAFRKNAGRRIVIHFHPNRTYNPKLLRKLIQDTGWQAKDLKRLKLIK